MKNKLEVKTIIINACAVSFLIMGFYFVSEVFRISEWSYISFAIQLFVTTVVIQVSYVILDKFDLSRYLLQIIFRYLLALIVVFGLGCLFNWYTKDNYWLIFMNVSVVFVITYLLGIVKLKSEIHEINRLIDEKNRSILQK